MELDLLFFAAAVPSVLIAGISKGGFPGAGAVVASPILALVIEPRPAVALMLPLLMLMDVASLRAYWGLWSWSEAKTLMLGAVPGVLLGSLLFGVVSDDVVRITIGAIAIGFVAYRLGRRFGGLGAGRRMPGRLEGLFWGVVAGFTSFVGNAGGPAASVYLLGRRLEKTVFQATSVIVFWWMNLIKFPSYLTLGMFTREAAVADLILAPVALAGVALGAFLPGESHLKNRASPPA
jgi:uncharacterized protein